MRVLVCGGRDYDDEQHVFACLDMLNAGVGISAIIEGGASGADALAGRWAKEHFIPHVVFMAEWAKFGKRAGFLRNQRMLDEGDVHYVVAFPGGRGTADMVRRAQLRRLTVWQPAR